MRKLLISFLLASSVAAPALAAGPSRDDRVAARQERQSARQEARSERQDSRSEARSQRAERVAPSVQAPQRNFAPAQNADSRPARTAPVPGQQWNRPVREVTQSQPNADRQTNERFAALRQQQQDRIQAQRDQTQELRAQRQASRTPGRVTPPSYARPDRPAPLPQTAYHYDRSRTPQWNTQWHNDRHHYDWRNYRNHHRSLFHLGVYFDPFGWGYQRFNIGWRLYPSYYGQSYWLDDPYMYNLPYAPWPYKWVRYYNDAVLVNIFTGQVEDVVYDFFW